MNASYSFLFFLRKNMLYGNSVAKIEVSNGNHWLTRDELAHACATGKPLPISTMIEHTFGLLNVRDDASMAKERFVGRKQVFLNDTTLTKEQLNELGWTTPTYPSKYGVHDKSLCAALLGDARITGVSIDAGNEISRLPAPAFKCLMDLLEDHGIPQCHYLDSGSLAWLSKCGSKDTFDLLCQYKEHPTATRQVIEVPTRCTADARLLGHAEQTKGHVLSEDAMDDYDMIYPWILHGAEERWPRMHRITFRDGAVGIPDFDIWAQLPIAC